MESHTELAPLFAPSFFLPSQATESMVGAALGSRRLYQAILEDAFSALSGRSLDAGKRKNNQHVIREETIAWFRGGDLGRISFREACEALRLEEVADRIAAVAEAIYKRGQSRGSKKTVGGNPGRWATRIRRCLDGIPTPRRAEPEARGAESLERKDPRGPCAGSAPKWHREIRGLSPAEGKAEHGVRTAGQHVLGTGPSFPREFRSELRAAAPEVPGVFD